MSRRPALAAVVGSLALLVGAAACGATGGGPTGPAAAPPPRIGAVTVDPAEGPIGTTFTLTASGLREGEAVAFEITFPGEGKAFPGAAIMVPVDGTVTTTYRATTANQPGVYAVRLTGPPGSLAEGRFTVTDGPPLTTATSGPAEGDASAAGPSTSGRTGTTSRTSRQTTTVKAGSTTTASSTKASSTTATTRRSSTTSATPSTVKSSPTTG